MSKRDKNKSPFLKMIENGELKIKKDCDFQFKLMQVFYIGGWAYAGTSENGAMIMIKNDIVREFFLN